MKISVAVPSFNQGRFLDACLGSIARQDFPDFEVLIADGGSRDESLSVIERYAASDGRFRLISREDDGQADAIRKAFAVATGGVLCFLNSDDCYLRSDVFTSVIRVFRDRADVSLVSFGGAYLDAEGRVLRAVNLRYHPLDGLHNLSRRSSVLQPGTFWRRTVYEAIGLRADFQYCFDAVFFYEAQKRFTWLELPDHVAGYRLHGANKSAGVRADRIHELARFERMKFGPRSLRAAYLSGVAQVAAGFARMPYIGMLLNRALYLLVNGLSFATAYRIPGI